MTEPLDEEPNAPPGVNVGDGVPVVRRLVPGAAVPVGGTLDVQPRDWRSVAAGLGFARVGVATIDAETRSREAEAMARTRSWVEAGLHGSLEYMSTPRCSPEQLLPGAKSVIVALAPTEKVAANTPAPGAGRVAAYARGADYHVVLKAKLWRVAEQICADLQRPIHARACVDTAPLLERFWAEQAGVTFTGKSTMAIAPGVGTNVMLAILLVDVELTASALLPGGCGECTLCLDACPTRAFAAPFVLDAARCIATLTIENSNDIAEELRPALGDRVFGCDECQTVCPYNASRKRPGPMLELAARVRDEQADLHQWASLTSGDYKRLTKHSALRRAPRAQLQRNAVVAMGNLTTPTVADVEVLVRVLTSNPSPLVRRHAAWSLFKLDPARARALLSTLSDTDDAGVRSELDRLMHEFERLGD